MGHFLGTLQKSSFCYTERICVFRIILRIHGDYFPNKTEWVAFFCEVRTELLNIMELHFRLRRVKNALYTTAPVLEN